MTILNILVRRHVPIAAFDETVRFYEALLGETARLRLDPVPGEHRIAQVSAMLIVGASPDRLAAMSEVQAAYLVDDLDALATALPGMDAAILEPAQDIPTGRFMMVRHPDGMVVEYVEHRDKHPLDRLVRDG
ncbi:MAG: glyoxalase [Novosphingobium lindaniclasticum]|jgi:predicted enzyme related to lactoylglutathione lyase|uniref:VOC family protein n=1 Tax=Novosphingobium lindaniclasticum TaxID=1329895 RepID=UPI002409CC96|nr:VOC family protein [Novosphingobium lindaniclasticum]MDF2640553.1 glyoxalase [Novosphingobium lindaniclasticum]